MAGVLHNVRRHVGRHLKVVDSPVAYAQRRYAGGGGGTANIWEKPLSPSEWKGEHMVIVCLTCWYFVVKSAVNWITNKQTTDEAERVRLDLERQEAEESELMETYGNGIPVSRHYQPAA
eukprot:TRINITY_DN5170_c1_g1_i4.p3 TRINITY_DN5170_c1_g1~~TRINITY_DN5170_c1_g1_i4.p3  ORF type:complete len:119 (-),score=19.31 TRINITY_DN5170_c1_g1_i4:184-540(-)